MSGHRPEDTPLETILVRHDQQHARNLRSAESARYGLKLWSDFFAGDLVTEITPARQREFIRWLREEGKSDGYILRVLAVGKAALNRAVKEGELTSVPHVDLIGDSDPRERVLTLEEAARLIAAAAPQPHLETDLWIAFGTGARQEAILELTDKQIDFDAGVIHLNPPGRKQIKKRRPTVPLCDRLATILSAIGDGPVVSYGGNPIRSIKTAFHRARDAAGLSKDVVPYTVRHTVASELRKRGVPVWDVAGLLGHTTGDKTTERYAKLGPDHLKEAAEALDALLGDLQQQVASLRGSELRVNCAVPGGEKLVEPTPEDSNQIFEILASRNAALEACQAPYQDITFN